MSEKLPQDETEKTTPNIPEVSKSMDGANNEENLDAGELKETLGQMIGAVDGERQEPRDAPENSKSGVSTDENFHAPKETELAQNEDAKDQTSDILSGSSDFLSDNENGRSSDAQQESDSFKETKTEEKSSKDTNDSGNVSDKEENRDSDNEKEKNESDKEEMKGSDQEKTKASSDNEKEKNESDKEEKAKSESDKEEKKVSDKEVVKTSSDAEKAKNEPDKEEKKASDEDKTKNGSDKEDKVKSESDSEEKKGSDTEKAKSESDKEDKKASDEEKTKNESDKEDKKASDEEKTKNESDKEDKKGSDTEKAKNESDKEEKINDESDKKENKVSDREVPKTSADTEKAKHESDKNEKKRRNSGKRNSHRNEKNESDDDSWSDFDSESSSTSSSSDQEEIKNDTAPNSPPPDLPSKSPVDTMVTRIDDVRVPSIDTQNSHETHEPEKPAYPSHRPVPPSSARSARSRRDEPIATEGFKPRPPSSPRPDPRFAHLRSSYSRRYYMTGKEPDPPAPRPEPSPAIRRFIDKAIAEQPMSGLPDETYDEVIMALGEKRKDMAASHRYQEGIKYSDAIKHVSKYQVQEQKMALQKTAKQEYEKKRDLVANEIKEFDDETKRLLDELTANQKVQKEQLLETQRKERDQHREKWTSEHMTRMYNRASNHLTALRRQHAFLLVQCRFSEAEEAGKRIKELAQSEEDEHARLMQFQYDESVRKLKQKQQDERMFFENNSKIQTEKLIQNRAKLRQALENKEKKVAEQGEFANDTERVWNAQQLHRKDDLALGKTMHVGAPSSKMTRKDIRDKDVGLLTLPPLKLDREIKSVRRSRRKQRQ